MKQETINFKKMQGLHNWVQVPARVLQNKYEKKGR